MSTWVIASIALKLCVYLAVALAIGGVSCMALTGAEVSRDDAAVVPGYRGAVAGCLFGVLASTAYFFVRVGDFAGSGAAGIFDPVFVQILWESPVGNALQYRLFGFSLLIGMLFTCPLVPSIWRVWHWCLLSVLYLIATASLAVTFSLTGHSAELGAVASVAVIVHVLIALWWAGALYPLWRATFALDKSALQRVLHRFGIIAGVLLLLMVLGGGTLLYVLLFIPTESVSAGYAAAIIGKLALVALLFCIAAVHKWRSVPRLLLEGGLVNFRRSLCWEMAVMLTVLAVTAILSTVIGPFAA